MEWIDKFLNIDGQGRHDVVLPLESYGTDRAQDRIICVYFDTRRV